MAGKPASTAVRVIVRCRPLIDTESDHTTSRIQLDAEAGKVVIAEKTLENARCFLFDRVFPSTCGQSDVMKEVVPLVEHVLDGFNATVLAYGQTGSGKTFTIEGFDYANKDGRGPVPIFKTDPTRYGIIPRAIQLIFDLAREKESARANMQFELKCSYYQIYNERVTDLLNPSSARVHGSGGMKLSWHRGDTYAVENLFMAECDTPEEMKRVYFTGAKEKAMGSHTINQQSSRSHCIFTIHVARTDFDMPEKPILSQLTIVDLAGSEKLNVIDPESGPKTVKESIQINISLFVLGQVIALLSKRPKHGSKGSLEKSDMSHVPYRDSKLTKLLKNALGGNSLTTMLACISPSDMYIEETVSTLTYASKARKITNVPFVYEDPMCELVKKLRMDIATLEKELACYKALVGSGISISKQATTTDAVREQKNGEVANAKDTELAEKLVEACKAIEKLTAVNSELRSAFNIVRGAMCGVEKREMQLNAENIMLRERIEMLESIVLSEDALTSSIVNHRSPGATPTRVADSGILRTGNSVREAGTLSSQNDNSTTNMGSSTLRWCTPLQLATSAHFPVNGFGSASDERELRPKTVSAICPPGKGVPIPRSSVGVYSTMRGTRLVDEGNKHSRVNGRLAEYANRYFRPNLAARYKQYHDKMKPHPPFISTAHSVTTDIDKSFSNLPPTIAETIPQSVRIASQFGALSFGGSVEDVGNLEERRRRREEKKQTLLAEQELLRNNLLRTFTSISEEQKRVSQQERYSLCLNTYTNSNERRSRVPKRPTTKRSTSRTNSSSQHTPSETWKNL
ncbi:Microtubule binding Kinesin motor domain [Trypanosoma vivax]|uniref:Kinesin-like protein n=1 Tax=Trypanosoma vivax (strain Y486) TaxID=1055687 RepID=G0TUG2_TRYVY|nr:Microtubule binding Kinesin motor domain [Trypanosoma vivax]CCC47596.1 putative kinesin [Trypanosoma vivax Y486]